MQGTTHMFAKHEKPGELEDPFQEQVSSIFLHLIQTQKMIFLTSWLMYTLAVFLESAARTHGKYQTGNCGTGAVEYQRFFF